MVSTIRRLFEEGKALSAISPIPIANPNMSNISPTPSSFLGESEVSFFKSGVAREVDLSADRHKENLAEVMVFLLDPKNEINDKLIEEFSAVTLAIQSAIDERKLANQKQIDNPVSLNPRSGSLK